MPQKVPFEKLLTKRPTLEEILNAREVLNIIHDPAESILEYGSVSASLLRQHPNPETRYIVFSGKGCYLGTVNETGFLERLMRRFFHEGKETVIEAIGRLSGRKRDPQYVIAIRGTSPNATIDTLSGTTRMPCHVIIYGNPYKGPLKQSARKLLADADAHPKDTDIRSFAESTQS